MPLDDPQIPKTGLLLGKSGRATAGGRPPANAEAIKALVRERRALLTRAGAILLVGQGAAGALRAAGFDPYLSSILFALPWAITAAMGARDRHGPTLTLYLLLLLTAEWLGLALGALITGSADPALLGLPALALVAGGLTWSALRMAAWLRRALSAPQFRACCAGCGVALIAGFGLSVAPVPIATVPVVLLTVGGILYPFLARTPGVAVAVIGSLLAPWLLLATLLPETRWLALSQALGITLLAAALTLAAALHRDLAASEETGLTRQRALRSAVLILCAVTGTCLLIGPLIPLLAR
jgi:hypothetical protein